MTRKNFMRCCGAGACSCAGIAPFLAQTAQAQSNPEIERLKSQVDFAQKRFATLVGILDANLDEATRKRVWESLGRDHGREYRDLTDRFKGNLEGFLEYIRGQWVATADYDAAQGIIRVVDKSPTCTCPLVRQGLTPRNFCDCTLGWQKEVYSAVIGRPVEATLEESILRGGKRCVFRIQVS